MILQVEMAVMEQLENLLEDRKNIFQQDLMRF